MQSDPCARLCRQAESCFVSFLIMQIPIALHERPQIGAFRRARAVDFVEICGLSALTEKLRSHEGDL